jgi:hypothetical protein
MPGYVFQVLSIHAVWVNNFRDDILCSLEGIQTYHVTLANSGTQVEPFSLKEKQII